LYIGVAWCSVIFGIAICGSNTFWETQRAIHKVMMTSTHYDTKLTIGTGENKMLKRNVPAGSKNKENTIKRKHRCFSR
jgi:hypothetical protein